MTVWVLDDRPFGVLAQHLDPAWSWPAEAMHLVAEVAAGASRDKTGRRQKLLELSQGGRPCIAVHTLLASSPAGAMLWQHLRPNADSATRDLGEDASISFCATERRDAVFVTADKGAAFVALAELGPGRVATPFDLWFDLREERLITPSQCLSLCDATLKADSGLPGLPRRFA